MKRWMGKEKMMRWCTTNKRKREIWAEVRERERD